MQIQGRISPKKKMQNLGFHGGNQPKCKNLNNSNYSYDSLDLV